MRLLLFIPELGRRRGQVHRRVAAQLYYNPSACSSKRRLLTITGQPPQYLEASSTKPKYLTMFWETWVVSFLSVQFKPRASAFFQSAKLPWKASSWMDLMLGKPERVEGEGGGGWGRGG